MTTKKAESEWRVYNFYVNGGKDNGFLKGTERIQSRCKSQEARDAHFNKIVNTLLAGAFMGCYAQEEE